ncbi:MAG TPA: hypothetical protein VKB09_01030 [Thermomicrobiales bacterium]|nr:hypothetical protein [Thermomicrobiales bacterium]
MPSSAATDLLTSPDAVNGLFDFEDSLAIGSFLGEHPFLVPLLVEVHQTVPRYFPDRTRVRLQLLTDRDNGDHVDLFAIIETALSEDQALRALDSFDEEWWLGTAVRGNGWLTIDVETARDG